MQPLGVRDIHPASLPGTYPGTPWPPLFFPCKKKNSGHPYDIGIGIPIIEAASFRSTVTGTPLHYRYALRRHPAGPKTCQMFGNPLHLTHFQEHVPCPAHHKTLQSDPGGYRIFERSWLQKPVRLYGRAAELPVIVRHEVALLAVWRACRS